MVPASGGAIIDGKSEVHYTLDSAMNEDATPIRGKHLVILAAILGIAAFAWLFYFADVLVVDQLKSRWIEWYGVKWFEASDWQILPIFSAVTFGPMVILLGLAVWLFSRFYYLNIVSLHETNLKELGKAKVALQQSLVSIATIEKEYRGKLQSFERLSAQLEELQSVKDIDTQELRKKLNAIALASRRTAWFERFLGLVTGVVTSLLATYIWEHLR